ncbi:MAG: helix-turn-helix domain-containing protein [Anaerocolumna sp.]
MEIVKIGSNSFHDMNFRVERMNGYPYYLFLLVKTPARFILQGEEIIAESNSAIIYDINYPHVYSSYHSNYINDWIHFEEVKGRDFFSSLKLPLNKVMKIYDASFICDMIRLMQKEYYSVNTNKSYTSSLLLQTMFVKLSEVVCNGNEKTYVNLHYAKLVSLRNEIYNRPGYKWTMKDMAVKLNISSVHLQKIYRETFGISCITDVIKCRINYAKDILAKTQMTIKEVADICGYNNDVHFMRQFKDIVGVTPTEYRIRSQNHHSNDIF